MTKNASSEVIIRTEQEMLDFAEDFGRHLHLPATLVLTGDVGVGKTTFTQGLARAFGISEPVTSPSFTISRRYRFKRPDSDTSGELIHYDFYRLDDPGLMREELAESTNAPSSLTVIEWGKDILDILPPDAIFLTFTLNEDETRTITRASEGDQDA